MNNLSQFLSDYPGMSTAPCSDAGVCLRGKFRFKASEPGGDEIDDSYKLEIMVPDEFPKALPRVKETGGKIPRDGNFHVNPDGTICLGSPFRLLMIVHSSPSLTDFADKCLVPYLYAVSYKLMHGGDFVFGELAHGNLGIIEDYKALFGLEDTIQVKRTIALIGLKKTRANKRPCPCGCGKRLGRCKFHLIVNKYRKMVSPRFNKKQIEEYAPELVKRRRI